MGRLEKISHRGVEITLECIEAEELRVVAGEQGGTFTGDFGVYFILTTGNNNTPAREDMRSPKYVDHYIGQGGVVLNTFYDPNTGEEIFSGAELCDLSVMPDHQRNGYASLLTELRLKWLRDQGHTEAFFPDGDEPEPVKKLFQKLQENARIKFEKINDFTNPNGVPTSVYKVSNF